VARFALFVILLAPRQRLRGCAHRIHRGVGSSVHVRSPFTVVLLTLGCDLLRQAGLPGLLIDLDNDFGVHGLLPSVLRTFHGAQPLRRWCVCKSSKPRIQLAAVARGCALLHLAHLVDLGARQDFVEVEIAYGEVVSVVV